MRISTEAGTGHAMRLAGRFDAHEIQGFRDCVEPLLLEKGTTVRLDMTDVLFVDSSALAELVRTQKSARTGGGELILTSVSDPVRVILELTALAQVFTIESGIAAEAATPAS